MKDVTTEFIDAPQPTYDTITAHGKKRRVRLFGQVRIISDGRIKVWVGEEYLFIKNEPRTMYVRECK